MLQRLVGLEQEYAVRLSGARWRPHHATVYGHLVDVIGERLQVREGSGLKTHVHFTQNGGALSYEALPHFAAMGLIEGSTPECRGPSQLLLYQQAQDTLLTESLAGARRRLRDDGWLGDLGLLKNCRDANGNRYGAQENYEVDIASGAWLLAYRTALLLFLPVPILIQGLLLAILGPLAVALLFWLVVVMVLATFEVRWALAFDRWIQTESFSDDLARLASPLNVLQYVATWPLVQFFRLFGFRPVQHQAMGFLVSRCLVTGAGTVEPDGHFHLSEKGLSVLRPIRSTAAPADPAIIDTGNLLKNFMVPAYVQLFRRRQRLQLGLSDANMCQVAEYLKVGTTCLVLDMIEAGALTDAPTPVEPAAAARALGADPTLRATIPLRDGRTLSAMELQRFYCNRARDFVETSATPCLEAVEIVQLWTRVLDALENDPSEMFGRLDWVTKRALIEEVGPAPSDVLKKVDLKYHELGSGYHALLRAEGLTLRLVEEDRVQAAILEPPDDTPARIRGRLIREISADVPMKVGWERVRVGGWLQGEVIPLKHPD